MLSTDLLKQASAESVHFVTPDQLAMVRDELESEFDFAEASGKVKTEEDLLSSIATALAFPDYFGLNWDALDECLTDLGWISPTGGVVLAIYDAERLWEKLPRSAGKLVESWLFAAEDWRSEEVPLHLIFVW